MGFSIFETSSVKYYFCFFPFTNFLVSYIWFSLVDCLIPLKLSYSGLYFETFYQNFLIIALYRLSKVATDATCKRLERETTSKWKSPLRSKKKYPQLENEATCKPKRRTRISFENAGNQLIYMDCANLPWQLKFYKQNSISRRHYCFLSSCLSWLRLRHYTACDWLNVPAVIFVGSCVENLILYFPQIWLAIRYLDGGNDPFTCLKPNRINRELWTVKKLPWMNTL